MAVDFLPSITGVLSAGQVSALRVWRESDSPAGSVRYQVKLKKRSCLTSCVFCFEMRVWFPYREVNYIFCARSYSAADISTVTNNRLKDPFSWKRVTFMWPALTKGQQRVSMVSLSYWHQQKVHSRSFSVTSVSELCRTPKWSYGLFFSFCVPP